MFTKDKLYRDELGSRVYLYETETMDIIYSEFFLHVQHQIFLGYKIYHLQFKSNHSFSLNKEELQYLFTLDDSKRVEPLHYTFSNNIKLIKYAQKNDLFFLSNLKNLGLLILIPKLDENNKYYFNLVLGVTPIFKIESFFKWDLESVILESIGEINELNLSFNYLKLIFDFENNKFRDNIISNNEVSLYRNDIGKKEGSNFSKKGVRFYKKIIFTHICYHLYWFGGASQLDNCIFQIDWGFKEKILIKKDGEIKIIESYNYSSLLDLISNESDYICFVFWKIFKYIK